MNIEIANRLLELRKKNGYSQEELANKLGISRQSVSKWERAEASPYTDNLILLAKIYNVSLDELLGASSVDVEELRSNNEVVEESAQKFDKKVKKYSLIKKTISFIEVVFLMLVLKIYEKYKTNEIIEIYDTIALAARENNCDNSAISKVCRGLRNKCGGFKWQYIENS